MSQKSLESTRVWSCDSFTDGIDQLTAQAQKAEQQEAELEKFMKDRYLYIIDAIDFFMVETLHSKI